MEKKCVESEESILPECRRGSEDLEVFIVEGQVEDEEEEEDAFIVVAAPSNPAEDNDDFVVIVGRYGFWPLIVFLHFLCAKTK